MISARLQPTPQLAALPDEAVVERVLSGEASFATWLTRIAVHEALARNRRQRRFVPIEGGLAEPMEERSTPDRNAENRELHDLLNRAVGALPPELRSVFILREVEGLSTEETVAALEISSANVRVRLHRAKAILKRDLDQRLGQETRRLFLFDGQRCDRLVEAVFARLRTE